MSPRQEAILEVLRSRESVGVAELARQFGLTEASIRLDLGQLKAAGLIRRFHGGARIAPLSAFEQRSAHRAPEKLAIARQASTHVHAGETLFLDSGSTIFLAAKELTRVDNLTIVTNSVPVLAYLGGETDKRVVVVGGEYSHDYQCCFGQATERLLSQIYVSTVFMGCDAVDVDNGIVLSHLRHLDYIGRIIGNARQTILLVDSDKFSTVHGIRITDLAAISLIITDGGLPEEMREKILRRGVGLEIAERSPD